jgi:hypothetical protein
VSAQLLEHRVGQGLAGGVPATGAEVVGGRREPGTAGRRRLEHLEALVNDLGADAVAPDDSDRERARAHRRGRGRCPGGGRCVGLPALRLGHGSSLGPVLWWCGSPSHRGVADGPLLRGSARAPAVTGGGSSWWFSPRCGPGRAGPWTPAAPGGPPSRRRSCGSLLRGLVGRRGAPARWGRAVSRATRDLRGELADYLDSPRLAMSTSRRDMSSPYARAAGPPGSFHIVRRPSRASTRRRSRPGTRETRTGVPQRLSRRAGRRP